MQPKKFLPSFSRQRSRTLKATKKIFLKTEYIPSLKVDLSDTGELLNAKKIVFEIGSGNGETASHFASLNPDFLYIACEVFIDGVIQMASKVYEKKLENIRFFTEDARLLLEIFENKLDKIFLFFPDPWPKKKHHKRRILTQEFLNLAFKALKNQGELFVATDHELYKEYVLEVGNNQKLFTFSEILKPDWWTITKYQNKAILENRTSNFYQFTKIS